MTTKSLHDVLPSVLDDLERRSAIANGIAGLTTGHYDLDRLLGGLRPGNLVAIGGPAARGTTGFALSIASHVGTKRELPVLYFALDESDRDIAERLILMESGVERQRFRSGRLTRDDWEVLDKAMTRMGESRISIDSDPCQTVAGIRSAVARAQAVDGLALVIVDRLQLVCGDSVSGTWSQQRPRVIYGLKEIATEMSIPVVVVSRFTGDLDIRSDGLPGIFQGDGLECLQKSDVILSLEENAGPVPVAGSTDAAIPSRSVGIRCIKNPNGRTGKLNIGKIALGIS
jgi:replicative DNA helicase